MKLSKLCLLLLISISIISSVTGCKSDSNKQVEIDIQLEDEKIREVIASIRDAHFNNSAEQFLATTLDTFTELRNGRYLTLNKSSSLEGLQSYFSAMEFLELTDVQEPVIEISDDASMATYIGSIVVKGYLNEKPLFSKLAWLSTLRKLDDQWTIVSNVNTSMADSLLGPVIVNRVWNSMGRVPDALQLSAKADCTGPTDPFETLVISSANAGRMEQLSSDGHLVLQHGEFGSWMLNGQSKDLRENIEEGVVAFVIGHEFHWLTLRPDDRIKNPVFKGFTVFNSRNAFKVHFRDTLGRDVVFYYDFESYRPLGFDYSSHAENEWIRTYFSDWTDDGKIPLFNKVVIEEGENRWEYTFTDVKLDSLNNNDFLKKETLLR